MISISIIGGGHNSLVTSIYLAKAGHDVTIYEQNAAVGGLCINQELIAGANFSKFASWFGMLHPQIIEDLGIGDQIKRIESDLSEIILTEDGDYYCGDLDTPFKLPKDPALIKTAEFFWQDMTLASEVLKDFLLIENPAQKNFLAALSKIDFRILPSDFVTFSLADLVTHIFGEEHDVASMFSTGAFYHPCQTGSAYGLLYAMTGRWSKIEGRLGRITDILYQTAIAHGVKFQLNSECQNINHSNGKIISIECAGTSPHAPDITIIGTDGYAAQKLLPDLFSNDTPHASGTSMFHAVLKNNPDFPALRDLPSLPTTICLTQTMADLRASYDAYKSNEYFANAIISLQLSGHDDNGNPMLIGQVHYAPEVVDDKDAYATSVIQQVEKHYPSFSADIKDIVFTFPQDIAATFGLTKINCFHGDLIWSNAMDKRSSVFGAGPSTPIETLYICSSLIHPGGTVSGMPGYRCAQALLNKLKTV